MSGQLYDSAVALLKQLIAAPSFSTEEDRTASLIAGYLSENGVRPHRLMNNVWAMNKRFDAGKPTILLNSHHDTVRPNPWYTRDPFDPAVEDGRLYGLGSNDAGGAVVSLLATFLSFHGADDLKYNLVLALTGEEEISGENGIALLYPMLPAIDCAIVGEPTSTELAVAEKGLMVLDCRSQGRAGHAARDEGVNAIYAAMEDLEWFRTYRFEKVSKLLGPVKMSVTVINAGKEHNVVPAECRFVVDVRVTDEYTHEEILDVIRQHVWSQIQPRSMRSRSSKIMPDHPLVRAGIALGRRTYGSPTSSDQALIPVPSLKCGPGDSARSHSADEFIYLDEIRAGIETYTGILSTVLHE